MKFINAYWSVTSSSVPGQPWLQYLPVTTSRWPDIIFYMRIEILALTNLHLDINEGILELDLYICTWRPPWSAFNSFSWPNIIFIVRIEILTFTNLHLDMPEGILKCYLYICTWPASSGLQVPRYYFLCENGNPGSYKATFRHKWRYITVRAL